MALSKAGQDETGAPTRSRKVSLALCVGVLLMPVLFVWFLMRPGYSTRSQVVGVAWLGVIGLVLLLNAPRAMAPSTAPRPAASDTPRPWETQSMPSNPQETALGLDFSLDRTRLVNRMLRTRVTLKNNVGRDLKYVEVFCSYYDGKGKPLGHGMSNWATVRTGVTVSGEVVASGVAIDDVKRRECRARHL